MKTLYPIALILLLFPTCKEPYDKTAFYIPGEWEAQEAVWLGWDGGWDEDDTLHIISANIINELQEVVPVVLWVTSDSLQEAAHEFLINAQVPMDRIEVVKIPGATVFWARDVAPAFVINHVGGRKAIDFNHTGFIRYKKRYEAFGFDSLQLHKAIARDLLMMQGDSLMTMVSGDIYEKSWIYIEGGAFEVNGKGSMLVSEPFLFRNLPDEMRDTITKKHFEEEFKKVLGINNVIWLSEGLAEEDGSGIIFEQKYEVAGTGGHVDEFARFVNANTILLSWVEDSEKGNNSVSALSHERMNKNYELLKNARDQDGKPFTIIKVPVPDHIFKDRVLKEAPKSVPRRNEFYIKNGFAVGDTIKQILASSYLNFLITEEKVLIPSYIALGGDIEKEKRVSEIFSGIFPEKKLVFINSAYINSEGGGIHCITRQVPKRVWMD